MINGCFLLFFCCNVIIWKALIGLFHFYYYYFLKQPIKSIGWFISCICNKCYVYIFLTCSLSSRRIKLISVKWSLVLGPLVNSPKLDSLLPLQVSSKFTRYWVVYIFPTLLLQKIVFLIEAGIVCEYLNL